MAGRWSDERERYWQEDRGEADRRDRERWDGTEQRSFERSGRAEVRSPDDPPAWQDRDYEGVSPAFQQREDDYESGYRSHPYRGRGGRFYGDDGRERIFREEYGYGAGPRYEQGRRFGSRAADERWTRELSRGRGTYSGGTGGYDYERGYGDGGRGSDEGFEARAREAGEFFRRTGRKVANWFSDVAGEGSEMGRFEGQSARGKGPKGYKRSDERINEDVCHHLTEDAWLDASDVEVAVVNGEVTLSGSVANRDAKHHAERLVEHLPGVTHVQNNLRAKAGKTYGDVVAEAHERTEGDAAMETSASAHHTTTRRN